MLDLRALCAPRAPCTRGLGLETTGRALALALSLPAARQLHCPCRSGSAVALHCAARAAAPFCFCLPVSFRANYSCPLVLCSYHAASSQPRDLPSSFGLCTIFVCFFVCDDLDSIRPHQSSSSLRRGQRRAERMSCPPAGPEGPSLLVFVCMLCSRSSPLREFLRAPAVSGVLTVFMDLSDSPTCRNQSATFGTLLGASTLSPVRAFLATNDSFVAISGCLFYTQTATL